MSGPDPTRRRCTLAALLVAAAVVLAGCAAIPTSGEIRSGGPVRADGLAPYVRVDRPGPQAGDSETQLVEGWFDAMSVYEPAFGTATQFLSKEAAAEWRPAQGTALFDGPSRTIERLGPGRVRVTMTEVARIGADGRYTRRPADQARVVDLRLVQDAEDRWRIADPPPGLFMSTFNAEREYDIYDVFFPAGDGESLVPEQVHLPVNGALPTLLVRSLLGGPSSTLAPAVRSAFPEGTELSGPGVVVDDEVAQVDLSVPTAEGAESRSDLVSAQLVWTLGQLPAVRGVRLSVDGVPVLVGGAREDGVQSTTSWRRFDPTGTAPGRAVYAVQDGRAVLVEDRSTPLPGPFGAEGAQLRSVAVDLSRNRYAAVAADGRSLLTTESDADEVLTLVRGADLSAPSFDRHGRIWVVDRGAAGAILAVVPGQPAVRVALELPAALDGFTPTGLRLARDGVRIALLATRGSERRVLVGVVVPRGNDRQLQVVGVTVVPRVDGATDVDWFSPTELAVLSAGEGGAEVELVALSGATLENRGFLPSAEAVAAAPGEPLVAATSQGRLYRLASSQQWVVVDDGTAPVYPG